MDLSKLERAYDVRGRKSATEPSIMFKILMYANMESIYSSRRIRTACQRDINFIWLLNGAPAPSYHEIARFRSQRLPQCAEELFFQLAEKLAEYGEIKFEHLFVDGTKIEATPKERASERYRTAAGSSGKAEEIQQISGDFQGSKQFFQNRSRRDIHAYERRPYAECAVETRV